MTLASSYARSIKLGSQEGDPGNPVADLVQVDLHRHSSLSDGYLSPVHVADRLAAAGVRWAALTDHNTVGGQDVFRAELEKRGVCVVSGVEMDVQSPDGLLHLLAYGFDSHDHALLHMLHTLRHPLGSSARCCLRALLVGTGQSVERPASRGRHLGGERSPAIAARGT